MKKIVAPEGFKDLIKDDCRKKTRIIRNIEEKLNQLGYDEINTPSMEYMATFERGFSKIDTNEYFKIISPEGKLNALRSDMTVPIARVVSTKYRREEGPLRFRYTESVYKIKEKYTGNFHELTDCGAELIGNGGYEEDLEILLAALKSTRFLADYGFIMELGDVRIFNGVCDYVGLSNGTKTDLAYLIDNKILPELEAYVGGLDIDDLAKEFFINLPWANGDKSVIDDMYKYAFTDEIKEALDYLKSIYEVLEDMKYGSCLGIDFSKIPSLDYYSSLIFEGYVTDVGVPILSGGRYDGLIGKFQSEDRAAVGFSVKADFLLGLAIFEEKEMTYFIEYPEGKFLEAIDLSKTYMKEGRVIYKKNPNIQEVSVRGEEC